MLQPVAANYLLAYLWLWALGVTLLVASMLVTDAVRGGVSFGAVGPGLLKAAGLTAVTSALSLWRPWGLVFNGGVWFFGLMFLYHLDWKETQTLTGVNWFLSVVCRLLVVGAALGV